MKLRVPESTKIMMAAYLFSLMMIVGTRLAFAQIAGCALEKPKQVNLSAVESDFRLLFCRTKPDIVSHSNCDKRWANIAPLMSRLSTDPNVPTIGSEAYMLATVYLEVGGKYNFKEATTEYVDPSKPLPDYYPWTGRGWVQFTYRDKYQRVQAGLKKMSKFAGKDVDLLRNKDLALDPEIAYTILVDGMNEGWFEVFRVTSRGRCSEHGEPEHCGPGVKLSYFVNGQSVDYGRARAVINANCIGRNCRRSMVDDKGFIPNASNLDRASDGAKAAKKF
jgi:hypothetical protein